MSMIIAHMTQQDTDRIMAQLLLVGLAFVVVIAVMIGLFAKVMNSRRPADEQSNREEQGPATPNDD